MQKLSVVAKLWLAFVALILVVMVPLELELDKLLTDFYANQVQEPLLYHSRQLAEALSEDPASLQVAPMVGQMVGGQVQVLDAKGKPVSFAGASRLPVPAEVANAARSSATFVGQLAVAGSQYIVTAVPYARGEVALLAPAAPVQQSLTKARRYLWLAGTFTLLLGTFLALLFSRRMIRPLLAIEQATTRIARGDFSPRVAVDSQDEIGQLAGAVNQMTAQLESYEQRRREFLANVAHELRTPLSYIRGYTQAITEGLVAEPEERERYLRIVQEESVRLGRLVDDLMDLAQMDEGQLSLSLQPLDLHVPIEQAAATVAPRAEAKGVALTVELPAHLPETRADGGRIQQVVVNLLDNGLAHTPQGGSLKVTATLTPGFITVAVSDTGHGIAPEETALIFERFYKKKSTGRGLGLAIVRSIIAAHGGELGVESEPGQGSTFWFRLKTAPEA